MKWNPPHKHQTRQQQQQQHQPQQQNHQQYHHSKMSRTVLSTTLRAINSSGNSTSSSTSSSGSGGEHSQQQRQQLRLFNQYNHHHHHQQQQHHHHQQQQQQQLKSVNNGNYARAVILLLLRLWWSVLTVCLISQVWLQQDYVAGAVAASSSTSTSSDNGSSSTTHGSNIGGTAGPGTSTAISTSAQLQQAQQDLIAEYQHTIALGQEYIAVQPSQHSTFTSTTTSNNNHHSNNISTTEMLDMIRANGLQLVMMGDSIMRYQYLDLIYYLHTGRWVDQDNNNNNNNDNNNIASEKSFSSWKHFFQYSNSLFEGMEACDCFRFEGGLIPAKVYENRYYLRHNHQQQKQPPDSTNTTTNTTASSSCLDVSVAFFTKFGKLPAHGHWWPSGIHQQFNNTAWQSQKNQTQVWHYHTWSDMIRHYIAKLAPRPRYFLFNAGLWTNHDLYNETALIQIKQALEEHNMIGIYKTTTPTRDEILQRQLSSRNNKIDLPPQHAHDITACRIMHYCFNMSAILSSSSSSLQTTDYWDNVHMNANINRKINEAFLQLLLSSESEWKWHNNNDN